MKKTARRKSKSLSKNRLLGLLIGIVIIVGVVAFGIHWHNTHNKAKAPLTEINKNNSQTTTTTPSSTSSVAQGGAIDNNGKTTTPPVTTQSQWATSTSGNLTLEQPVQGATLKSGDAISGTAKVDTVQFRLTDNVVGVIAQGSLSVVNGAFSGTLQFKTTGTSGRLDVFSLDPTSGAEINEVQVPINF